MTNLIHLFRKYELDITNAAQNDVKKPIQFMEFNQKPKIWPKRKNNSNEKKPQKLSKLEPNRIFRAKLLLNLNLSTFCIR